MAILLADGFDQDHERAQKYRCEVLNNSIAVAKALQHMFATISSGGHKGTEVADALSTRG